ncbi:MAG: hypothetical protein JW881_02850 [Spirochaetales bacterium]|nr:hypothetical protein [Spirochaetales bacterium]
MLQLYFISILTLFLGGLALMFRNIETDIKLLNPIRRILVNKGIQTVLGITALAVGILQFFVFIKPGGIFILEDLLPALTGCAIGGSLLLAVFTKKDKEVEGEIVKQDTGKIRSTIKKYHVLIGITGMSVAVIHLIFPGVVLL